MLYKNLRCNDAFFLKYFYNGHLWPHLSQQLDVSSQICQPKFRIEEENIKK